MSTSQGMAGTDRADPSEWPTVAWPMLTNRQRELFRAREEAVRRYCSREPLRVIAAATGVSFNSIRRLYERCFQTHADGRMQGFRALVPYERVKPYRRLAKIGRPGIAGKAGVFAQLLQRHPDLEALIVSELQEHRVVVAEGARGLILSGLSGLHRRFRQLCLQLGLTERDYPLVQKQQGIRSLAAAAKAVATRTFETAAGAALADKRSGGVRPDIQGLPSVATQPYDAVEFDGQRVDLRLRVVFERIPGVDESFNIERVWLLTIIDVCSRAVLGYHIVLAPEYSRFDVLKTVERSQADSAADHRLVLWREIVPWLSAGRISASVTQQVQAFQSPGAQRQRDTARSFQCRFAAL